MWFSVCFFDSSQWSEWEITRLKSLPLNNSFLAWFLIDRWCLSSGFLGAVRRLLVDTHLVYFIGGFEHWGLNSEGSNLGLVLWKIELMWFERVSSNCPFTYASGKAGFSQVSVLSCSTSSPPFLSSLLTYLRWAFKPSGPLLGLLITIRI